MGVAEIYQTVVDRRHGPGLLRNSNTAETPGFALSMILSQHSPED